MINSLLKTSGIIIFLTAFCFICTNSFAQDKKEDATESETKSGKRKRKSRKRVNRPPRITGKPVPYDTIEQDLNVVSQRYNFHEIALTISIDATDSSFEDDAINTQLVTSIESAYYFVLDAHIQLGAAFFYEKVGDSYKQNYSLRVLWNIMDLHFNKLVPFIMIGAGYSDYFIDVLDARYTGFIQPEAQAGIRYFVRSNIALNINAEINLINYEHSDADILADGSDMKTLKIFSKRVNIGFSLFF